MALTDEQKEWVYANYKGIGNKELVRKMNEVFQPAIDVSVIKSFKNNHKLNSGLTGRFEKGHIPVNKGVKGVYNVGGNRTSFKKGQMPPNTDLIGTEKMLGDGYVWVKINNVPKAPKKVNWKQKHVLIWEQAHGPVLENHVIIFLDGNRENFDLDNLKMVSREINVRLNQNHLRHQNKELTEAGVTVAELITTVHKTKRRRSEGK